MRPLRFRPPPIALTAELRWVLLRAFARPDAAAPARPEPSGVERLALALDLAPRIGARQGRERLTAELGSEVGNRLMARSFAAAGIGLRIEAVAREIAAVAERLGLSVAFLKFGALSLSGVVKPGSRLCSDLDVLAPGQLGAPRSPRPPTPPGPRARELWRALVSAGYTRSRQQDYEHQLETLQHPSGAAVEIHTCVLGVRPQGERSADYDALAERGLLESLPRFPPCVWVPVRDVLAAHAVVHGLAQHGSVPSSYPAFRMVADLADLSVLSAELGRGRWAPWICRDVSRSEVDALLTGVGELQTGRIPECDTPSGVLLAHLLAGVLDEEYAASLRLGGVFRGVTDRGRVLGLVLQGWHAAFPGAAELDQIYGPAGSARQRALRRALRPFDVARRVAGHAAARLRPRGGVS